MYEDVLVPTDGNAAMRRVVEQAVDLAGLCGARIHALHAIDETAYAAIPEDAREVIRDRLREDGEDAIGSIVERAREVDLETVCEIREGPPAHVIIAYAVEADVDVIVMGTHGRTGYERYLLGSVAERVVRSSPIPVLTVNLAETNEAVSIIEGQTVPLPANTVDPDPEPRE